MNLSMHDLSKIYLYCSSLPDCEEKELLLRLYHSYLEYMEIGTIEECGAHKEWLSLSILDIMQNFNSMVKACRDEVADIGLQYETKKRGRPRKDATCQKN